MRPLWTRRIDRAWIGVGAKVSSRAVMHHDVDMTRRRSQKRVRTFAALTAASTTAIVLFTVGVVHATTVAEGVGVAVADQQRVAAAPAPSPVLVRPTKPAVPSQVAPSVAPKAAAASQSLAKQTAQTCLLQSGQSTGDYASFPAVTTTPDGRVLAIWRVAEQHQFGAGAIMMSELGEADTCQWSAPRAILTGDDPGYTVSVGGITTGNDGSLVVGVVRYRVESPSAARDFRSFVLRSPDGGNSWDALREVHAGFVGQSYPSSVTKMPDGSIVMGLYGTDSPSLYKQWHVKLARSVDNGRNWLPWGVGVRTAEHEFTEPQLLVDGHRLLMTLRYDNPRDSLQSGAFLVDSADGGLTWSAPRRISEGASGMPTIATLHDGRYAVAYRDNTQNRVFRFMTSPDLTTWTRGQDITAGAPNRMLYAGFAPLGESTVVVYALENPEGDPSGWASVHSAQIR